MKTSAVIVACAIVIVAIAAVVGMAVLAPKAVKLEPEPVVPVVEVITVERIDETVTVLSQGLVEPLTATEMASEVSGQVTSVSPKFKAGGEFDKDEILVEIDPADYASALATAEANKAEAELALALEDGRARQAERDWKKLGRGGEPSDLVLRVPQLKSASAKVAAATAAVAKARHDLERTKVRAPYHCRVSMTFTDLGSFARAGSPVANLFSLGAYEVRLPVSLEDYQFVAEGNPVVTLRAVVSGEVHEWSGMIVRSEGQIDRASRSIYLVARVEPEPGDTPDPLLSPGLFLKAEIAGRTLEQVVKLPRKALYGNNRVVLVNDEDRVRLGEVEVVRTETEHVYIGGGLDAGNRVCITALAAVIDDMKVEIVDTKPEPAEGG